MSNEHTINETVVIGSILARKKQKNKTKTKKAKQSLCSKHQIQTLNTTTAANVILKNSTTKRNRKQPQPCSR